MDNTAELTVLAFCAGYAGIERGLDLAGVRHRVLAYVEIEAFAIANLVAKMEQGLLAPAPVWTDLKTFPAHLFRGAVDLITGGYPCQPFSAAGKRQGADDPRHLWPYIRDHIATVQPGQCFFENVDGHVSMGLSSVISDLEEDGYRTTWGVFSAAEVGAPHQRKRVYIMADSSSDGTGSGEFHRGVGDEGRSPSETGRTSLQPKNHGPHSHNAEQGRDDVAEPEHVEPGSGDQAGDVRDPGCGCSEGAWDDQCFWPFTPGWCPEPDVGRVVDGCADRVDRIRLLGNGAVPQTACKAWTRLSWELEQ